MRSLLGTLIPFVHVILSVLGVAFLVVAGFTLGLTIGFVALGLALLVLGFYAESEATP